MTIFETTTRLKKRGRRRGTIFALLIFLLLALINSGCWDKREIEDLAFITAWGIDQQEDGEILVSVVIAKPSALTGPMGESGSSERPFWLASSSGRTVLEAMCNFSNFSPRFLFCAHSRFVIFGEECARKGVIKILDFFERNREPRLTSHIFVVKEMTAAEFLKSEYELVPLPPEGGLGMLQNATRRLSNTVDTSINDFLVQLEEEGMEPLAGCWEVIPKIPVPMEGELKREEIIQSPITNGAAAFKGDRLVGWLNPMETRGLLWIQGKVRSTPLIVENPASPPFLLGIEVTHANSTITPEVSAGKLRLKIKIELDGNIEDVQGHFDPGKDKALIKEIENRMAKTVETEIKAVLQRCRNELKTDVFGFGAIINRSFPHEWERIRDRWDSELPRLEISLDINARIQLSGLIIKSSK